MPNFYNWRNFWIFWLGGIVIIAFLLSQNSQLVTDVVPGGVVDHQIAGSADRVNEIQQSWSAVGKLGFAKIAMIFDLLFIGLYSIGGIIGGRLIWQHARSPMLKKLGLLVILAYFLFGLLDYTETIAQFIQLFFVGGSNFWAGLAALVQPPKLIAFFVSLPSMIAALIWRRLERRA